MDEGRLHLLSSSLLQKTQIKGVQENTEMYKFNLIE